MFKLLNYEKIIIEKYVFQNCQRKLLSIRKCALCKRSPLDEYVYKFQVYMLKMAGFCHFESQKDHFSSYSQEVWLFCHFQILSNLGPSKVFWSHFLRSWWKYGLKTCRGDRHMLCHFFFLKLALADTLLAVGDWYFTGWLCVARALSDVYLDDFSCMSVISTVVSILCWYLIWQNLPHILGRFCHLWGHILSVARHFVVSPVVTQRVCGGYKERFIHHHHQLCIYKMTATYGPSNRFSQLSMHFGLF